MPQFWIEDYVPQLFWLAVSFAVFYWLMAKVALPRVADVLAERRDRIAGDLDRAEGFRVEAEKTIAAYEAALAEARAAAQAILAEAAARNTAAAERRAAEVGERLAGEAGEAAGRIDAAKTEALVEVRGLAADLAATAVTRLIGQEVTAADAKAAVAEALEGRR
jgi:F-type H+-transporting ATPase subunit b